MVINDHIETSDWKSIKKVILLLSSLIPSRGLADSRDIIIKQAVKGSCGLVWCRDDYIKEDNKNLEEKAIYKDIKQFFRTW